MKRLKVLVWHVHGSYLYYLSQAPHDFYVPFKSDRSGHYSGKWGHIPWPDNLHDVPAEEVRRLPLDCVLFQTPRQYLEDQYDLLSPEQLNLPKVYLEHDPPRESPTDTRHLVNDPNVLLVHVTPFNALMWDCGRTPTAVIDHGAVVPDQIRHTGEIERGLVVVNHLGRRGRRLGADVFDCVRSEVPLDLVGMASEEVGGLGEVLHRDLPAFESHYRFFFNPIRYTSLGLAVVEAMMVGLPVVGLATTEMATVIENGVSGFVDTDVDKLVRAMKELLRDPGLARKLGENARKAALERFNIRRFADDWSRALALVTGNRLRSLRPLRDPAVALSEV